MGKLLTKAFIYHIILASINKLKAASPYISMFMTVHKFSNYKDSIKKNMEKT